MIWWGCTDSRNWSENQLEIPRKLALRQQIPRIRANGEIGSGDKWDFGDTNYGIHGMVL